MKGTGGGPPIKNIDIVSQALIENNENDPTNSGLPGAVENVIDGMNGENEECSHSAEGISADSAPPDDIQSRIPGAGELKITFNILNKALKHMPMFDFL